MSLLTERENQNPSANPDCSPKSSEGKSGTVYHALPNYSLDSGTALEKQLECLYQQLQLQQLALHQQGVAYENASLGNQQTPNFNLPMQGFGNFLFPPHPYFMAYTNPSTTASLPRLPTAAETVPMSGFLPTTAKVIFYYHFSFNYFFKLSA